MLSTRNKQSVRCVEFEAPSSLTRARLRERDEGGGVPRLLRKISHKRDGATGYDGGKKTQLETLKSLKKISVHNTLITMYTQLKKKHLERFRETER